MKTEDTKMTPKCRFSLDYRITIKNGSRWPTNIALQIISVLYYSSLKSSDGRTEVRYEFLKKKFDIVEKRQNFEDC